MAGHQIAVEKEAEGCVIVESLELFSGQATDEMVASKMKDVGPRGSCQGMEMIRLERCSYRTVLLGDDVVKCSAVKTLELAPEKMLKRRMVREKVKRFDVEQQAATAHLQSKMIYYGGWPVSPSTSVSLESNKNNKKARADRVFYTVVHTKSVWTLNVCLSYFFRVFLD